LPAGRLYKSAMNTKISALFIRVLDMNRATDFYVKILGFKIKFKSESYTELETKNIIIALEKRTQINAVRPTFTITSKDIEKDIAFLKEHCVKFWKGISREDYGAVSAFFDSEGNIIELVQYKK
jgi:predicted enzyme related to lactoylglutathione lyase